MATWRVGRNLSEGRTTELRKKVHKWKGTPKSMRQPRTLVAWAREHGITVRRAGYLLAQSLEPSIPPIRRPARSNSARKHVGSLEQGERLQGGLATFGNIPSKVGRASTAQDGATVPTETSATSVTPEQSLQPDPVTPGHGWNCVLGRSSLVSRQYSGFARGLIPNR